MEIKPVEILLVEDNPGDARLTEIALKENKIANNLHVAVNGIEAMKFLHKAEPYADMPTPDVILLDLNLPQMDGREVLADIKSDETLKRIPVVILTTSDAEEDILKTYNMHANCYITKPVDLEHFVKVIQTIESFWFCIVKLPPK